MKKKVCIVVLFLLLCLIKSSGVLAEEEKKILKTVVDDNGQVSSCTSSNTINTVKICDTENECNSVKNIYFCTQFELTYSNGKSCENQNLGNACGAGVAHIIDGNKDLIFKANGALNNTKVNSYDCGYNMYYHTTFLLNAFLYNKCGSHNGRYSYSDLTKNSLYKSAEEIYEKVSIVQNNNIIKFDKDKLTFDTKGDKYVSSVKLDVISFKRQHKNDTIPEDYTINYKNDNNFKVVCNLTGNGVTFDANGENKPELTISNNLPYDINIYSNEEIGQNKVTLSCKPEYKFKYTKYYNCGESYQDVVSGNLSDKTITGKIITISNKSTPNDPVNACDVDLEKVLSETKSNSKSRIEKLIGLYEKYNKEGLLDFDNPCCDGKCTEDKFSCLNASFKSISIENSDSKKLYCTTEMNLNSSKSYYDYQTNHDTIFSGELYFNVYDSILLDGTIKKVCYNESGDEVNMNLTASELPKIKLSDIILEGKRDGNKLSYSMDPVYVKLNGEKTTKEKCISEGNCKFLGYGLLSPFNSDGVKKYEFKIDGKIDGSNINETTTCEYSSTQKIIKDNKPQLEFRIIDTDHPFIKIDGSERETMRNWCDKNNNEFSCASDNEVVKTYIKEKTNSYNQKYDSNGAKITGDGVKYKITLTPSLMKDIVSKYKDKLSYNKFNLECRDRTTLEKCKDTTLDENKVYETSELLTYLKETSKDLTISGSTKRKNN